MQSAASELLTLFVVIGIGLALGKLAWRGLSLGTSGVIFAALVAGHFGFHIPDIAGDAGIILFVYCLGIGAGPGFLRAFLSQGKALAAMAVIVIGSAVLVAYLVGVMLRLDADLATGLFAGALTSTPALASAAEVLSVNSRIAVGFGVAYPFGVIGVIVFVQALPRCLGTSLSTADAAAPVPIATRISRMLVEVLNPAIVGKRLSQVAVLENANCQVPRWFNGRQIVPIPPEFTLQIGQRLLVVGPESRINVVAEALGQRCEDTHYVLDAERQRRRVVIGSRELVGRSLKEMHLLSRFGVTIARITRHDIEFVPTPHEQLQFGDAVTAVGEEEGLNQFTAFAGHRERTLDETDLISLAGGLSLGILLGQVKFTLLATSISLGMAGGPLLVGLALGHFGRVGRLVGHMPRSVRLLLTEIGLALFLADAGIHAGEQFVAVIQENGLAMCAGAIAIVAIPLVVAATLSQYIFKFGLLEALGGICGATTSTPGLGAVTSQVDSSIPAASYAAAYPIALVLVTILAPVLASLLQHR